MRWRSATGQSASPYDDQGVPDTYSVDLLVPTVARTEELARFLEGVATQVWQGQVRVILVDQNADDRLASIVSSYERRIPLVRLHSEPGVSRACNTGLRHCVADIVGRADDDCWYPPDVLERVVRSFEERPTWDGLCGITCDDSGRPTQLRWDRSAGVVTRGTVFRRSIGSTLFMRRSLIESVGLLDESYGPRLRGDGTVSGGSEDGEYVLRMITKGFTVGYVPELRIHHANFEPSFSDSDSMQKAYSYGVDHSRLLKQYDFATWYAAWRATQLFAATGLFLAKGKPGKARFYAAMARGRVRGMFLDPQR